MRGWEFGRIRTEARLGEAISAHFRRASMPAGEQRASTGAAGTETAHIVRYPNRRFYDRSQGRYVTLRDIAAMIRAGKTVSVRESKTNDEITSTILTQIILEQHPERMDLLPVPVLHLMIRTNGVVLGLLREYFRQSLEYLEFWQRASALNPVAASMQWLNSLAPVAPRAGDAQPPGAASGQTAAEALAQRLAEMERRLNALEPFAAKDDKETVERRPRSAGRDARRRSSRDRDRPRDKD
jgi:polyhydroxyalkanoate synthesis repressor PhaR